MTRIRFHPRRLLPGPENMYGGNVINAEINGMHVFVKEPEIGLNVVFVNSNVKIRKDTQMPSLFGQMCISLTLIGFKE